MQLFFAVIFGMMYFPGYGVAQEENVNTAASSLEEVLVTLKQSVVKLNLVNDQWTARDNAMKAKVLQLQMQLGRLETQGDLFKKTAAQLRIKNPRRANQIARLEQENSDLDNRIHSPEFQSEVSRQKERLKLIKMIEDSQQRQETLLKKIK
jgi:hypothetical protein